jgi:putative membrane protein
MNVAPTTLLATHDDHHGWWLLWPVLWLGVIVTVVWLFKRRSWASARPQSGADRASDVLAERFAHGEISSDEYRERLEQFARRDS